jgi:hypothetical protein
LLAISCDAKKCLKSWKRVPDMPAFSLIGFQTSASNLSESMNPEHSPVNRNALSALPTLRSASIFMTLSVAEMRRCDFLDFGGPTYHSHFCAPSLPRRFEIP